MTAKTTSQMWTTPETTRVGTSTTAQDAILAFAAMDAALATITPADAAQLTRFDLEMIAKNITHDVQTMRLHSYNS